jgi:hypothetical protein
LLELMRSQPLRSGDSQARIRRGRPQAH